MSSRVHYLILGLGSYPKGSGIGAVRFLLRQGARLTITDRKTADDLSRPIKDVVVAWRRAPKGTPRPTFVLGRHRLADVDRADVIVRNPGVPSRSPMMQRARRKKKPIENDVTLFVKNCTAPIVAVTGTRGKSTTAAWIADMLRRSGRRVLLAGNISTSPLRHPAPRADVIVLELSSWQLEDLGRQKWHPQVAVVTNVLVDHLNTYPDMRAYAEAKAQIFKYQTPTDIVVLNKDNPVTRRFGREAPGQRWLTSLRPFREENGVFARGKQIVMREKGNTTASFRSATSGLPGKHNLANSLLAIAAARAAGATARAIGQSLRKFRGLPSRQELIRTVRGVRWINDTTATTPDATIAALRRFGKVGVLIAGGTDKKLVFDDLAREIKRRVRLVVLLPGTGTEKLARRLTLARLPAGRQPPRYPSAKGGSASGGKGKMIAVSSMREAVRVAALHAWRGDVVVLSPGATSFGLFKNEYDRGDTFVRAVKNL